MTIIVQTTSGDVSSLNGKIKIPHKTLDNITRALIMNASHNKYFFRLAYQYVICLSCQDYNRLRGDVPYLLCNGTRPS